MKPYAVITIGILICVASCTLFMKRDVYSVIKPANSDVYYQDKDRELSVAFISSMIGFVGIGVLIIGINRCIK